MNATSLSPAMQDPMLRDRAEREAERLLEALKREVLAEAREVGVLRRELKVTVPASVISDHMAHNYDELMHDAVVPGFRKGRAPRALVEKRFGGDVRESLKSALLGQSFFAAVEKAKLDVLGDPLFQIAGDTGAKLMDLGEALDHIKLPDKGDFTYACEVELRPEVELPELKGIEVKTPNVQITDEMVNDHIERQLKIRGRYEPIAAAADSEDIVIADVVLFCGDEKVKTEDNVQLGIRPTRLDGIALLKLDKALKGAKAGDTRSTDCEIPNDYERTDLRGKPARFDFTIHEVKRLTPETRAEYIKGMGFANEDDLLKFVHDELEEERDRLTERAKSEQVLAYLLESCKLELPEGLSARQTDRAVVRRVIELQQRGMPISEIDARIDELRTSAVAQVQRDLKLGFVLDKVAEKLEVRVTDEEVNSEIARIARLYNRRFDRVRDDLQKQGLLPQLAEQIRHDKCVTLLLKDAKFVAAAEVAPAAAKAKAKPRKKAKDDAAEST